MCFLSQLFNRRARESARSTVHAPKPVPTFTENDIIIVLVGPSGAGKSSFINKAAGSDVAGVGHRLFPSTGGIKTTRITNDSKLSNVVLVDTRSFDDTENSGARVLRDVFDWLNEVCQTNILLSAILCFHRISDNRVAANHITVDPLKHLFMFRKLCGNEAESRIVLTTTMWDEVQETVGKSRLVELESTHWKTMIERGSTTFRYWNTQESARELLQMVAEQTVQRRGIQSSLS